MKSIDNFSEFTISTQETRLIKGGYYVPSHDFICSVLYAGIGISHMNGDRDGASRFFWGWVNAGC